MRRYLSSLYSIVTFERSINFYYISNNFQKSHDAFKTKFSQWPISATRKKLINEYWFNALIHYCILISIPVFSLIILEEEVNTLFLSVFGLITVGLYLPLYVFLYRPTFTGEFLPNLETAIAVYEGRERSWLEKCKQDQLSVRALVFLFFIIDKCIKINCLAPNDKCADILHRIFGVSPKALKNELDLIFKKQKREKMEHRKQIEVAKSFEEVYTLLEELQFPEGILQLKQLEQQFKRP